MIFLRDNKDLTCYVETERDKRKGIKKNPTSDGELMNEDDFVRFVEK